MREVKILLKAKESLLPGNFKVYRTLPQRELRRVGGFVFLDHFDADNVFPEMFDVPPHPHIGLQTVTYLFEGEILHTDSLDFQQKIEPGAVNWMTAGRGITHAEQVVARQNRLHGIQSWVGLPHHKRKTKPSFEHFGRETLPYFDFEKTKIRVIAGSLEENVSPIPTFQDLTYLDVEAAAGSGLKLSVHPTHELAVYVCEGKVEIASQTVEKFTLALLTEGAKEFEFASAEGARFIVFGGEKLSEPTVIYWNFIADTVGEAKQALIDWKEGKFPAVKKYKKIAG